MKSANLVYRTSSRKPELHTETLFNKQIFFSLSLKKKKENKKQTNKKASKTKITKQKAQEKTRNLSCVGQLLVSVHGA